MKLLSKFASHERLKPWDIADFDVEVTESPEGINKEQILALFQNGGENSSGERDTRLRSILHPAGSNLVLTGWQPGEIDLQSSVEVNKEWVFAELPYELPEDPEPEIQTEIFTFEQESAVILNQARVQAEEILLKAQAEADQIIRQAQADIEQEKKNGYQQGWDAVRSEMQETLKAVAAMVDEIQKWQADFRSQGEQTIIEMLKEMAQTMFGEGVHLNADALQVNLNRIMENAQRLGDLNIFLNPGDANLLDPSWKEYQFLISGNKVRVIPSEKIKPGGCIVKGNTGMVDGRVETQLAAILNTFDELREVAP